MHCPEFRHGCQCTKCTQFRKKLKLIRRQLERCHVLAKQFAEREIDFFAPDYSEEKEERYSREEAKLHVKINQLRRVLVKYKVQGYAEYDDSHLGRHDVEDRIIVTNSGHELLNEKLTSFINIPPEQIKKPHRSHAEFGNNYLERFRRPSMEDIQNMMTSLMGQNPTTNFPKQWRTDQYNAAIGVYRLLKDDYFVQRIVQGVVQSLEDYLPDKEAVGNDGDPNKQISAAGSEYVVPDESQPSDPGPSTSSFKPWYRPDKVATNSEQFLDEVAKAHANGDLEAAEGASCDDEGESTADDGPRSGEEGEEGSASDDSGDDDDDGGKVYEDDDDEDDANGEVERSEDAAAAGDNDDSDGDEDGDDGDSAHSKTRDTPKPNDVQQQGMTQLIVLDDEPSTIPIQELSHDHDVILID